MSDTTNTGGFAFPVPGMAHENGQERMTLRDYFAAKAMQAYIRKVVIDPSTATSEEFDNYIARSSYETADAMLKWREAKP